MKDREALLPNRRKITYSDGLVEFVTIEYADQPSEEGTPLSKATFLTDATATALGLDPVDDPLVDDALLSLQTNKAAITHASRHASSGADPTVARYPIAVTATWVGASAPFTQEVSVTGVTAGMVGKVDIVFDSEDDLEVQIAQRDAWRMIDDVDTGTGTVTLTCFEESPSVAFNLQMEVIL